jgi:hypothetical protein
LEIKFPFDIFVSFLKQDNPVDSAYSDAKSKLSSVDLLKSDYMCSPTEKSFRCVLHPRGFSFFGPTLDLIHSGRAAAYIDQAVEQNGLHFQHVDSAASSLPIITCFAP